MPFYRDRPLTGPEIEEVIERTMDTLEEDLILLEQRSVDAAKKEAAYRARRATLILRSDHKTVGLREAWADQEAADMYEARKIAEALRDVTQESCRVRRSELEALRTLASSARAVETGRG